MKKEITFKIIVELKNSRYCRGCYHLEIALYRRLAYCRFFVRKGASTELEPSNGEFKRCPKCINKFGE